MLDFGFTELLLIIAIAVLVIGPDEIPALMTSLGRMVRRLQYMRYALTEQFDDFLHQTDLAELQKEAMARHTGSIEAEEHMDTAPEELPDYMKEGDTAKQETVPKTTTPQKNGTKKKNATKASTTKKSSAAKKAPAKNTTTKNTTTKNTAVKKTTAPSKTKAATKKTTAKTTTTKSTAKKAGK